MKKGSFRWPPALAASLASAALLTACGGGDDGTTVDTEAPRSPSGRISPQSSSFQQYSGKGPGKLHIAEFGTEARKQDRLRAQATVEAYLQATGKGEWSEACRYLSEVLTGQIEEIAEGAKQIPKPGCGEVLQALASSPGAKRNEQPVYTSGGIASLRIKEGPGGGFALFHGSDGNDHWMAVRREGSSWKVLSPAPQSFSQE